MIGIAVKYANYFSYGAYLILAVAYVILAVAKRI